MAPQTLTPGVNTLQFETATLARNSWGPVERNRSNGEQQAADGRPLTLNSKVYGQGYGVHSGSELRFSLQGAAGAVCNNFTAEVGVDDEVGTRGSVIFQVFADGVKLYDSGVMTGSSVTKQVNVGVVGRHELRLVVTDAGNGISYDHADWADPQLDCATTVPVVGSADRSFGSAGLTTRDFGTGVRSAVVAAAVQPDGKLLLAGDVDRPGVPRAIILTRVNPDGTPDPTFSQAGSTFTSAPVANEDLQLYSMAQRPDGRVLLGGTVGRVDVQVNAQRAVVLGYLPNGAPDPAFGVNGVREIAGPAPDGSEFLVKHLFTQPGGQVLAQTPRNVYRLTATGAFDPSYGLGGQLDLPLTNVVNDALQSPDGHLLVLSTYRGDATVRRYLPTGQLDPSFGTAGVFTYTALRQAYEAVLGLELLLLPDGRFVAYLQVQVAAPPGGYPHNEDRVVRHLATGAIDSSFDGVVDPGYVLPPSPSPDTSARFLGFQPDGKALFSGEISASLANFFLTRTWQPR